MNPCIDIGIPMPQDDLQPHIAALTDRDAVARGRAVDALAEARAPDLVGLLRPLLSDSDWVVRFKAACALAWAGDDAGGSVLVEALTKRDLCFIALQALTALGSDKALPGLRAFFGRRFLHPLERLQAAAALVRCGDGSAAGFIDQRLARGEPTERGFALELWGRLRLPGALDKLQAVLVDPVDPHRLDAVRGLAELGDTRARPLLARVAREQDDPELAAEARAALADLDG